jgi:NAD-dependent deacetylase
MIAGHPDALDRASAALRRARSVAVITGAGISAESGIPTFRGAGGLWRTHRPEDLATPEAFARDPALVWEWYWWRRGVIAAAAPNPGHRALARLEARVPVFALLTQNVDGLHVRAGSRAVVELHGNIWRARCVAGCTPILDQWGQPPPAPGAPPATCGCGAWLRPDVVWFGEGLDPAAIARAEDAVRGCDVLLVVGTSAVVYPVAALPSLAQRGRALVVEVNPDTTPLSARADCVLTGQAGDVLPELERRL